MRTCFILSTCIRRLTNVWLNEVCSGVELSPPLVNETTLYDFHYSRASGNAPNPSTDSVMPT